MSDYRSRVLAIYEKYAPEKAAGIENVMTKYKGEEDELIEALVCKYGPEPGTSASYEEEKEEPPPSFTNSPPTSSASTSSSSASEYYARVLAMYQKYNPAKVGNVETVMEKYKGQEDHIMEALVRKYGPEPATASSAPPAFTPFTFSPGDTEATTSSQQQEGEKKEEKDEKKKEENPYRKRLEAFFREYDDRKLETIDKQLDQYKGSEEDLIRALIFQYGPEPKH